MGNYHSKKEALLDFYAYWKKHCPQLEDFHWRWLTDNGEILAMKRGQPISEFPHQQSVLYIVLAGVLAKERYCPVRREKLILTVALPYMGFFTTIHIFSNRPALGDLVCIQPGLLLKIPYKAIALNRDQEAAIETLIDLLGNKKKSQLDHLRVIATIPNIMDRYFYFADNLPHLATTLSQNQQAMLLHVSERSIQRARQLYGRLR